MTSENDGFDVEAFAQEGLDEAGVTPDEYDSDVANDPDVIVPKNATKDDAASTATKSQAKETQDDQDTQTEDTPEEDEGGEDEDGTEAESIISQLLPKPEQEDIRTPAEQQKVPLEDHIKLRKRAQAAERELAELKQQVGSQPPTGGEKPGELSPLEKFVEENPDEDFLPPKVLLEENKYQERRRQQAEEAQRKLREEEQQRQQQLQSVQQIQTTATTVEKEFRKKHPDYDRVTKAVLNLNLLTPQEREQLIKIKPDKMVETYYKVCKAKLASLQEGLGISTPAEEPSNKRTNAQTPAGQEPEEPEEYQDDEEIFRDIWKK